MNSTFDLARKGERDLVQIVYVGTGAAALSQDEVAAMAEQARTRSEAARLTGLLLYHGRHFYAIVEGPRRRVLQRIEEIVAGQEQRELQILREEPIAIRRFANWSFGALAAGTGADGSFPSEFLWSFCARVE